MKGVSNIVDFGTPSLYLADALEKTGINRYPQFKEPDECQESASA